jgi:putative membrane protein
MDNKDTWALYRTDMANERNLLAFVRTGLSLLGLGLGVLKLWDTNFATTLSIILIVAAIVTFLFGFQRYNKFKEKINLQNFNTEDRQRA